MIRVWNVYFPARTLLLGASEVLLVYLAFAMAVIARAGADADIALSDERGLYKIALIAVVYLLCMYYFDLYDSKILSNRHQVLTRLLQVLGLGSIIMAIVYSIYPHARLENGTFLVGMLLALPFLILWRQTFFLAINSLRLCEKTVIVGHGPLAVALEKEIRMRRELGLNIVGYFDHPSDGGSAPSETRFLGNLDELAQRVDRYSATRIIIAMEDRRGKLPIDELLLLKSRGIRVQDGAELYEHITGKVQLESLRAGGLLFSTGFRTSRALLLYKRCFSIVFSILFTAITLPLMLVAAVAIRLESKGPIIFRQQRVGKDGKIFIIFKFRTMRHDPDVISTQKAVQNNDDRVTRVGRWLRRTRLDELPQLFNILRGEMYFVGPRPFPLEQEKELVGQIPFYRQRWAAKPGATGWAQINRGYNATLQDNVEKLSYDLFYIKNISIGLDLLILFQTFKILLFGRGAR